MNRIYVLLYTLLLLFISGNAFADSWIKKLSFGGDARHRSTAFSLGNKGYMGLGHVNATGNILYEDIWEYDPASNTWMQKANYGGGLNYHAACFVVDNIAYVGTGRILSGDYTTEFYKYDVSTNTWTAVANFPGPARRGAIAFAIEGKGYVGTGQTLAGVSKDFYQYDPASDNWSTVAQLPGAARTSAVAFELNDKGYVGTGGSSTWGNSLNDFWEYTPSTNSWIQKANVGPTPRMEATGFSVYGKGFIGTGDDQSSGTNYGDFWEYDPTTNTWIQIQDFFGMARRYLVAFTIGNSAYVGLGTNGTNFKDFWEFDYLLSVIERDDEMVQVKTYPNPATDYFTVDFLNIPEQMKSKGCEFKLFSATGQLITSNAFVTNNLQVDVARFERGIYFYQLVYKSTSVKSGKIILN
jgi:N-acetylneuraminic acid mutarotase